MKYILIIFIFASCKYRDNKPEAVVVKDTTIQVCDFDINPTEFNITDREIPEEPVMARGGKKPKVVNPPPPSQSPKGVLLIDFDGHLVRNTSWNFSGDILCAESGLIVSEQQRIIDTVAFRYRQFNIAVTTDSNVYNAAPAAKRMRCIVTKTYEWFGQAGGVSFIGSFKWGDNTPCFVFSLCLNFNTKFIQEAITHECGHSIGLFHQSAWVDGVKTAEYLGGVIMGIGYYVTNPPWHKGLNPYGQEQNDTVFIKAALQ